MLSSRVFCFPKTLESHSSYIYAWAVPICPSICMQLTCSWWHRKVVTSVPLLAGSRPQLQLPTPTASAALCRADSNTRAIFSSAWPTSDPARQSSTVASPPLPRPSLPGSVWQQRGREKPDRSVKPVHKPTWPTELFGRVLMMADCQSPT